MEDPNLESQLVAVLQVVVKVALAHQSSEVLHQNRRLMALGRPVDGGAFLTTG